MNRRKRSLLFWMALALVSAIIFRVWHLRSPGILEKYSSYAVYPFLALHRAVADPFMQWMTKRRSVTELEQSLTIVQAERDELMAESIELRSKLRYQEDIKELNDSQNPFADAVVCNAQIIAKNFSPDSHYLLLDAGEAKGVTKDMVVIYKQCLVGKVSEVYPWYCKVIPITDRTCKVAVLGAAQKTTGIHEGKNNLTATQLNYVSHLEPVEIGDYLISSGEGLVFPRGLGVGQIATCTQDGLYHVIEVKPLVDLQAITYCTIIQRGKIDFAKNETEKA